MKRIAKSDNLSEIRDWNSYEQACKNSYSIGTFNRSDQNGAIAGRNVQPDTVSEQSGMWQPYRQRFGYSYSRGRSDRADLSDPDEKGEPSDYGCDPDDSDSEEKGAGTVEDCEAAFDDDEDEKRHRTA